MLRMLKHIKNLKSKRVLLRVDFNVPIDKSGVTDDTRIRETLPTIKFLLKKGARVIVITHLGRPQGKFVDGLKLDAVAKSLAKIIKKPVTKLTNCVGKSIEAAVK
jgi:phosphoglycerate kinase